MFCKCGRMMKNFDGVNFGCSCGRYLYRNDPDREMWLVEHGSKTCLVCGRVALEPGMMPDNGNGYICIHCCAEYEHDESTGRIDLYPLSSRLKPKPDHKGKFTIKRQLKPDHQNHFILKVSTVFFLILMVYLAGCAVIVKAEAEAIDVYFKADPMFKDINDPINLADMTREDTVIGEWERDLGDEMPNGTYYGAFLPPGQFEFNLKPSWFENGTIPGKEGRFSYVMLASHFNLSAQKIMAGASEWWMRVPVHPDSIEVRYGLTLSIFKNVDNASDVELYGDYYTRQFGPRVHYNDYRPDEISAWGWGSESADAGKPGSGFTFYRGVMMNGRLYLRVNAVLEPSVDYVLALSFRLPRDGTLKTFFSTSDDIAGRWSVIDYMEVQQHHSESNGSSLIEEIDSAKIEFPLDLDWSFIFTEGIGMGGLFGKTLTIEKNQSLVIFPFFNTSRSGEQYMSFNLPFISSETAYVQPSVWQGSGGFPGCGWHVWRFALPDLNYYFDPVQLANASLKQVYNYTDFILFSTNETLHWTYFEDDDRWNVRVEFFFNETINLTLLCYQEDRPRVKWSVMNGDSQWNSSINPFMIPFIYDVGTGVATEIMSYKVWLSARGTGGQWVMRNGTASGRTTYTYYFPNWIYLSSAYWEVNNETDAERVINVLGTALGFMRDTILGEDAASKTPQGLLLGAFRNAIMLVWNGLTEFGGWVMDGLSRVWDAIKRFGNFILTKIIEFVGKIWNFIGDIVDTIAGFWQTLKFLVAPIMLIAIIVGGSKMSKKLMTGRGD